MKIQLAAIAIFATLINPVAAEAATAKFDEKFSVQCAYPQDGKLVPFEVNWDGIEVKETFENGESMTFKPLETTYAFDPVTPRYAFSSDPSAGKNAGGKRVTYMRVKADGQFSQLVKSEAIFDRNGTLLTVWRSTFDSCRWAD